MSLKYNTSITEKIYKKLSLQVSLKGLSFCIFDTLNFEVVAVKEIDFADFPEADKVEDHYWKAFLDYPELMKLYDEIVVVHENNLSTFVPNALFDEQYLSHYLEYNTKVFETDFFAFDTLENYDMKNVYIPYVNVNNYLIDQFGPFEYRHTQTVLVEKLLDLSKNIDEKQVFVHFRKQQFEIVVVENQKLLLFNSFEYHTPEDFIYYLLFTAEQLKLNPEHFKLRLLGAISEEDPLYAIAYKYVRNTALLDTANLEQYNNFGALQNLKHFILFNL
ncbi:DUF3822 family protein [Flavobacterium kingsejongi]|uniref:DUF3822 domain-containing protein n=1 Tax=Flavobacterium kingsejongi TaxID=1678728 RepID=A0A2S1LT73_9FLAO|nr:DUF3822 family protein [Flavobacterium kingsejongi]AWG26965.1 hypothetical protein FK004_17860 [Flavobacterium kingsejongi]